MSVGANQPLMGASQRARNTLPVFQTWSSIDQEIASHRASPLALGTNGFARYGQRSDRASILDRIIAFCVAAIFGIIGAGSLLIGIGYWFV